MFHQPVLEHEPLSKYFGYGVDLGPRTGSDLLMKLQGDDTRVLLLYLQLTGCHPWDPQL